MVDLGSLDALARGLDDAARRIEELARRLAADVDAAPWEGPAAVRYRAESARRIGRLRGRATELVALGMEARAVAASVRAELDQLYRIERSVRSAMATVPNDIEPPWHNTQWAPHHLPAAGSPAWRNVLSTLRSRGLAL